MKRCAKKMAAILPLFAKNRREWSKCPNPRVKIKQVRLEERIQWYKLIEVVETFHIKYVMTLIVVFTPLSTHRLIDLPRFSQCVHLHVGGNRHRKQSFHDYKKFQIALEIQSIVLDGSLRFHVFRSLAEFSGRGVVCCSNLPMWV